MINKWEKIVEKIVEKYNGYIQAVFLILTLILGIVINKLEYCEVQLIIIDLTVLISLDMIVLNIKNSILQNKLESLVNYNKKQNKNLKCLLKYNKQMCNTVLINIGEGYNEFPLLLQSVNNDLFISGMACNGVWNHTSKIEELLKNGYYIRILISSEKAIENNVRIYYGLSSDKEMKDYFDDLHAKICITLNALKTNQIIKSNYNKNFEVRRTDIPFTTAYVGINIYGNSDSKKQLKITQYVPGHEKDCQPNIILDSNNNNDLYEYHVETLKKIWDNATPVSIS